MSILYKPVVIESAEQAEALPLGTVATLVVEDGTTLAAPKRSDGRNGFWWDEGGSVGDEHMVGWTALVPIEAEEEILTQDTYANSEQLRRYVTPWQRFTEGAAL